MTGHHPKAQALPKELKAMLPPLRWSDPPANTKGFALIADDPDAPVATWVHWVLYGLPATLRDLPESVPPRDTVSEIGSQGANDFRKVGYGGPCPPPGRAHRYFFKLYALDTELPLPVMVTRRLASGNVAFCVGRYPVLVGGLTLVGDRRPTARLRVLFSRKRSHH